MTEIFFIGDTHFGHKNILTFKDEDGNLIRPGFSCIDDMNERLVDNWNSVVRKQDKVIHLGDVAFGKEALQICKRLNGIKHLVLGNHDGLGIQAYAEIFSKIFGVKYVGKNTAICTHIPIHQSSFRHFKINIHGHLHEKTLDQPQYFNVSCEQIGYQPICIDSIMLDFMRKTNEVYGFFDGFTDNV